MKKSKEPIEAPDAIPEDGILLVDAYERVLDLAWDHPERVPKFDDHWSEILEESEKDFAKMHDPNVYDAEAKKIIQTSMMANLCLRLALEEEDLAAYVRDPKFDRIIKLSTNGWTEDMGVPVPDGIWSNYFSKGAHPCPQGTLINGELQPIYLKRKYFEKWLANIFSDEPKDEGNDEPKNEGSDDLKDEGRDGPKDAGSDEPKDEAVVRKKRGPEQARIRYIANILWPGQRLPPDDLSNKECLAAMNIWCEKQNRRPVGERTYWRFLEKQESLAVSVTS